MLALPSRFASMPRLLRAAMALIVLAATAVIVQAAEPTPKPPTGFSDEKLAKISNPTSIAFLHDGRALVADQSGKLYLWQEGVKSLSLLQDIGSQLCTKSDAGLLGVVVAPQINNDGSEYYYMFFTMKGDSSLPDQCPRTGADDKVKSPFERVSRFTFKNGSVVADSEQIVLDHIPTRIQDHTGGSMFFAQDGYLYISTGDGDVPQKSNDPDSLRGKILRIDPANGDGVPGNPYFSAPDAVQCGNPTNLQFEQGKPCREVFAMGLRHPWRTALKPGTDPNKVEFYINDVGKGTWEEIDAGKVGADYGWDKREGFCALETRCVPTDPGTGPVAAGDPLFSYMHDTAAFRDANPDFRGCSAVTGAAFVPPGVWPKEYDNVYLFADYVCGRIWRLDPNGSGGYKATIVIDDIVAPNSSPKVSVTNMTFGPAPDPNHPGQMTQALYYGVYNGGGQLRRIIYTGGLNRVPTAAISADKTYGNAPLTVTFSGAESSDPDTDTLTYDWDFGDGQTSKNNASPTKSHTYPANGTYTAQLVVHDNKGGESQPVTIRIDVGNNPPVPTIVSPPTALTFSVGQTVTLSGSASDPEDGALAESALTWHVLRHHDTHTHEELFPTKGNNIVIPMTEPEGLSASKSSYFEIQLGAVDSQGLTYTVTQDLRPHVVDLTFQTEPAGLQVIADDITIDGEATVPSWENYAFPVSAPVQQDSTGRWWVLTNVQVHTDARNQPVEGLPMIQWPQQQARDNGLALPDDQATHTLWCAATDSVSKAAGESAVNVVTPAVPTTYVAHFEPLTVGVPTASVQASLNAGQATINVQLNGASTEPVTVAYSTADGTATAGIDYTPISGTLTFEPGETTKTVAVPLIKNDDAAGKTFSLVLSEPSQATLGASVVTITLTDAVAVPDKQRVYLPLLGR